MDEKLREKATIIIQKGCDDYLQVGTVLRDLLSAIDALERPATVSEIEACITAVRKLDLWHSGLPEEVKAAIEQFQRMRSKS